MIHDIDKGWLFHTHAWYLLHEIIKNIPTDGSVKTILDFGGGSGIAGSIIQSVYPEIKVTVLDITDYYIDIWTKRKVNWHIIDEGETKVIFPDNTFDMVISSHVLEHIENYKDTLSELVRVCKYKCLIVVPDGKVDDPTHKHIFNRKSFQELFSKYSNSHTYPLYHPHINNLIGVINKC